MKKFTLGTLAATLLLSLVVGIVAADPESATSIGIALNNATVVDEHLMGIGVNVSIPFRENRWTFNAGGSYEFGRFKREDSNFSPTDEFEFNTSGYRVRAGVDRQVSVGPALFYCGSGLFYSSHKATVKQTGFADQDTEPYNVFGLSNRMGSSVPLTGNPNLALYGQINNTVGFGSVDDSGVKTTQTDVSNGAEMGIRYYFPTQN